MLVLQVTAERDGKIVYIHAVKVFFLLSFSLRSTKLSRECLILSLSSCFYCRSIIAKFQFCGQIIWSYDDMFQM